MTKAEYIYQLFDKMPDAPSVDIAALAECHPAYVRAVKQRRQHPNRVQVYEKKRYERIKANPALYIKKLDDRNRLAREALARLKEDPEAYASYQEKRNAYYRAYHKAALVRLKQNPEAYAAYRKKKREYHRAYYRTRKAQ